MNTVLLPTDFSENAFNAVKYAMAFFKEEPCQFILMHAYEKRLGSIGTFPFIQEMMEKEIQHDLERIMQQVMELNQEKNHHFEALAMYGAAANVITDLAKSKKADVIIMGTQGASGWEERFIGSNTVDVIRMAQCPVIAIFKQPKRIAFATDLNPLSQPEILTPLIETVQHFDTHLMVVHTCSDDALNVGSEGIKESIELRKKFRAIHDTYHYVENESPLKGVAQFIEEHDVQMLAMITRNRSFFERIFHPSSVEKMAFHLQIPLFALPGLEE